MNKKNVSLTDRYTTEQGQILISGVQALVRLPIDLMRRDRRNSLNTGTFISGYRGSPLGGYDLELGRQKHLLQEYNIKFQPAVNEELGATAVWGTQQVNLFPEANVDGVCGIWYGKTPGVDRSTDAFRHANAAGSAAKGGVLVVAGDDHGCKSSSYPGQSEFAFVDMHMPILNPSNVQEVLDYGIYGIELSRYSGCWVAMITLTENMDSSATVNIDPNRVQITQPTHFDKPKEGVNIRLGDTPLEQEERLWRYKRPAAIAFCRENKLNKVTLENEQAKLGIVSTGKAHLDLLQAMSDLGIDEQKAKEIGIRILKVAMTYPLDVTEIRDFARGLDYLFVVEEKRSLMEVQLKEELYNVEIYDPHFPKIIGKLDSHDIPLLPAYGELSPSILASVLLRALPEINETPFVQRRLSEITASQQCRIQSKISTGRTPFFCSGCPHNTSTKIPDGSRALAGIGCHYLVQNMDRNTHTFTQMGAEGVSWIGQSAFSDTPHVFTNLGDGTYFHSGVLAIRAAVAAKINITYKILFNDAVAMTGGQRHDGELRPDMIANQVLAEGVSKLVIVMDDVKKYQRGPKAAVKFPPQVSIYHRDDMEKVQLQLRETKGVTVIIYDQMCATELRRQRKRGTLPQSNKKVIINDLVCEGCSDCSVQSNCTSVEPKETALGLKRQINQTSCNMDLSCVKGFCPSFVTVVGGTLKKPAASTLDFNALSEEIPLPSISDLQQPWSILITGVGGTGVVTVGALLAMASYIEDKAVTVLDQTGLAQKGGAVYSHIRIARTNKQLHAVRIGDANADTLIACDLVAAGNSLTCLSKLNPLRTKTIVNTDMIPTSDFVLGRPIANSNQMIIDEIDQYSHQLSRINASEMTQSALGNTTTANIFMLGYAYQQGGIPLELASLHKAIEINGVAVEDNIKSFNAGRLASHDVNSLQKLLKVKVPAAQKHDKSLSEILAEHVLFLTEYQDAALAKQYMSFIDAVRTAEQKVMPTSDKLTKTVAQSYFRLLSYKDEYEVARLYTNGAFEQQLADTFTGNYKLQFHLAPEVFTLFHSNKLPKKITFGPWIYHGFKLLAKMKGLRNTAFDIFSYTADRKKERAMPQEYKLMIDSLLENLTSQNYQYAVETAQSVQQIRGFGHVKMKSVITAEQQQKSAIQRFEHPPIKNSIANQAVEFFDPLKA